MPVPVARNPESDLSKYRPGVFDTTCNLKPGMPWVKWCPIDIVLWTFLFLIIILVSWKVYITKRTRATSPRLAPSDWDRSYCRPFAPPHLSDSPEGSFNPYHSYVYNNKKEPKGSGSDTTLIDPYLINRPFSESLIAKDAEFTPITAPPPYRDCKSAGRYSLGLCAGANITEHRPHFQTSQDKLTETAEITRKDTTGGVVLAIPEPAQLSPRINNAP